MTRGMWISDSKQLTQVLDIQPLSRRHIDRFLFDSIAMEKHLREAERSELQQSADEFALKKLSRKLKRRSFMILQGCHGC